jgi:hypothetical protein
MGLEVLEAMKSQEQDANPPLSPKLIGEEEPIQNTR